MKDVPSNSRRGYYRQDQKKFKATSSPNMISKNSTTTEGERQTRNNYSRMIEDPDI